MPKDHITITAPARKYWESEYKKYLDGCEMQPVNLMEPEQRQFFTCEKLKPSDGTQKVLAPRIDANAAQLLIDQALLTLEKNGFVRDEIECLREWMTNSAPRGAKGQAPVPIIDNLAAHYLFERMTGEQYNDSEELAEILATEFPNNASQHATEATRLRPHDSAKDQQHRLNTMQAKKLLRELLGIHQNTLGGILNK